MVRCRHAPRNALITIVTGQGLFLSAFFVGNLLSDFLYVVVDPRIDFGE